MLAIILFCILNNQFVRVIDLLHAVRVVHVVLTLPFAHQLAGVDVPPAPGRLDRQGLDDLAWGTLGVEEGQ